MVSLNREEYGWLIPPVWPLARRFCRLAASRGWLARLLRILASRVDALDERPAAEVELFQELAEKIPERADGHPASQPGGRQIFFASFVRGSAFQSRRGGGVMFRVAQADVQFFCAALLE